MRARTARWLATAALVLSIAGCGGAPAGEGSAGDGSAVGGPGGGGPAGTSASSGGDTSSGADTDAGAVSVRVVVTGGITGARHIYEVSRQDRAGGLSADAAERVLALADSPAVRTFAGEHLPSRAVECCDLQVFEVTITHADGSHTAIRTTHTRDLPRELDRMLALLAAS